MPVLLLVWAAFDFFYLYSIVLYRPLFLVFSFLRWAWLSFDSAHGPTCERKVCPGETQSLTPRCTWSKTNSLYPQPAYEFESTNSDFGWILTMFKLSSMPWVPSEALALKTTAGCKLFGFEIPCSFPKCDGWGAWEAAMGTISFGYHPQSGNNDAIFGRTHPIASGLQTSLA